MASPVADAPNRNIAFALAFFEELARAGVGDVCICPGSRSAPLAIAATKTPQLRRWTHIDERSAAFFALGLAKARRRPVALICTSGTAAANFLPAVVEAHYAHVPLVVLTADRPAELREWGAGQTIDQVHLFGRHVRWFAEAPIPEPTAESLRTARALASRAAITSAGTPCGPVHLNLPFREPLDLRNIPGDVPVELAAADPLAAGGRTEEPYVSISSDACAPSAEAVERLATLVATHSRGVVACGPLDDPDATAAIARFAERAGWPILADPTSQLRCGDHIPGSPVIAHSDLFLRDENFAAAQVPDVVVRFGATPTSKAQRLWFERHAPNSLVMVDPDRAWNDPSRLASHVLHAAPGALCSAVCDRIVSGTEERETQWLDSFRSADRVSARAIETSIAYEGALLEPGAVRDLASALPEGALLYVSNSMPVRDLDAFLGASPAAIRILCNRGANGIDGLNSSALGAAAANCGDVFLLTGDLAFAHDVGGLMAAHRHDLRATIIVFNNDGGGIFSFLPVAKNGIDVAFEEIFHTPHGLDFAPIARAYGARFTRVESSEHFRAAIKESRNEPRLHVIEVPIDRDRSVAHHRNIERAVSAALLASLRPSRNPQ